MRSIANHPLCVECGFRQESRYGLCQTCMNDEAIRAKHASAFPGKAPKKPLPNATRDAAEPTDARPGTLAKLEVLMGRAERGERLWHPLDFTVPTWHGFVLVIGLINQNRTLTILGTCGACADFQVTLAWNGVRWLCRECWGELMLGLVLSRKPVIQRRKPPRRPMFEEFLPAIGQITKG